MLKNGLIGETIGARDWAKEKSGPLIKGMGNLAARWLLNQAEQQRLAEQQDILHAFKDKLAFAVIPNDRSEEGIEAWAEQTAKLVTDEGVARPNTQLEIRAMALDSAFYDEEMKAHLRQAQFALRHKLPAQAGVPTPALDSHPFYVPSGLDTTTANVRTWRLIAHELGEIQVFRRLDDTIDHSVKPAMVVLTTREALTTAFEWQIYGQHPRQPNFAVLRKVGNSPRETFLKTPSNYERPTVTDRGFATEEELQAVQQGKRFRRAETSPAPDRLVESRQN